jgi:hypothetical protein
MSGPYALAAFGDAIVLGHVNTSATLNFALVVESYQHAYGNIYSAPTDVFEAQYAGDITSLLPSTPATAPAALASIFAMGFGTPDLVNNNYRLAYLRDRPRAALCGRPGPDRRSKMLSVQRRQPWP